jgi:single-strand DNA-binding protein
MASLNQCNFIGNLTKDPETRYMTNGDAVTNVSIAVNETWKDKSGEKQEKAEFINLTFYRKLAEIAGEYLKKGAPVYVSGKMETRKYTDKNGVEKYSTSIIVNEMQMLGGKRDDSEQPKQAAQQAAKPAKAAPAKGSFDDFDSSIPF